MGSFLFDLDGTLVDSSAIETLRRGQQWPLVMNSLHRVVPFAVRGQIQPHQLPGILKNAGHSVGIVTNSPKHYATAILNNFQIPFDTLVAYGDTVEHKPRPAPLQLALANLHALPQDSFYIGDDIDDFEAAYHARMHSIAAGWGIREWEQVIGAAATVTVYYPDDLLPIDQLAGRQYFGEIPQGIAPMWHSGSMLWLGDFESQFALGRYFASHDPRHAVSPLSKTILEHKRTNQPSAALGAALATAMKSFGYTDKYDFIVGVPPKPNKDRDRIGEIIAAYSAHVSQPHPLSDALRCLKDYGDLKKMTPPQRIAAVHDAFHCKYDLNGQSILLVDDVLTTGATTNECIRMLRNADATKVGLVVLAKDQRSFEQKLCIECGSLMKTRTNSKNQSQFWGCSAWPNCEHTESIY